MTAGWPIPFLPVGDPTDSWGLILASVLPAFSVSLFRVHRPDAIADISGWAAYWDLIFVLMAVIAIGLAIRSVDRSTRTSPFVGGDDNQPVADEGLAGFNSIRT